MSRHPKQSSRFPRVVVLVRGGFTIALLGSILFSASAIHAAGGDRQITFHDIATDSERGLSYQRAPSASEAESQALRAQEVFTLDDVVDNPDSPRGMPGLALLDVDGDRDLDLYVTNGPGAPNHLFVNQLAETGELRFIDLAVASGVAATDQDSTGACFGDLDNDGDPDLLVLGNREPHRLFANRSDGTFDDVSAASGLDRGLYTAAACSFGDIDGDGRLDLVIANAFDANDRLATIVVPFAANDPNELFRNLGGMRFQDISAASGIRELALPAEAPPQAATITWAAVLVDLDLDGDLDLLQADDQAAIPTSAAGGVDRGFLQMFENDGTGQFRNVTAERGLAAAIGNWMGLALGDFDRDGTMDFFGTNVGTHIAAVFFGPEIARLDPRDSRWFLRRADGTYADSAPTGGLYNPFGWGAGAFDVDNDADLDILYHGGFDFSVIVSASPAALLRGDGAGGFERDREAFAGSTNHLRRNVRSMAVGDLDGDGFDDVVSVSNFDYPEPIPLASAPPLGGDFDDDAKLVETFRPLEPGAPIFGSDLVSTRLEFPDGSLAVELNGGESGHRSITLDLVGTVGLTTGGRANRDGLGAVIRVWPLGERPTLRPVVSGASIGSQDSRLLTFGLGEARRAVVDIVWPGGARNRYFVATDGPGKRVVLPELPCDYEAPEVTLVKHMSCVLRALDELGTAGVVGPHRRARLLAQSVRAWRSAH